MTKKLLLDSNRLIRAFDGDPKNPDDLQVLKELQQLNDDPEIELLAITPLIRYEVLRGIRRDSPGRLKEAITELEAQLGVFDELQVTAEVARLAADVYRYVQTQKVKHDKPFLDLLKRGFDLLHCACADIYGLDIVSNDKHIKQIQKLITDFRQQ